VVLIGRGGFAGSSPEIQLDEQQSLEKWVVNVGFDDKCLDSGLFAPTPGLFESVARGDNPFELRVRQRVAAEGIASHEIASFLVLRPNLRRSTPMRSEGATFSHLKLFRIRTATF
jgi:hypothetical protein